MNHLIKFCSITGCKPVHTENPREDLETESNFKFIKVYKYVLLSIFQREFCIEH